MRYTSIFAVALAGLLLWACGDDTHFRISGTVQGLGTRSITLQYVADGAVRHTTIAAIDGKYAFEGNAPAMTVAEFFNGNKELLGRVLVKNGQTLHCDMDVADPYAIKAEGNKQSEQWSAFMRDNAEVLASDNVADINALVARYVENNTGSMVSTALLLTEFHSADHEGRADSLLAMIKPDARPDRLVEGLRAMNGQVIGATTVDVRSFSLFTSGDSIENYSPGRSSCSLLYFTGSELSRARDKATADITAAYDRLPRKRFRVVEVSMSPDTTRWRLSARLDSVGWPRVWVVGGQASPHFDDLNVPRLPYFIVADSTGRQLYRGSSSEAAIAAVDRQLENH